MKKIPLTQGQFALVDDEDFEWLNGFRWHAHRDHRTFYATRKSARLNGHQYMICMHRQILSLKRGDDQQTDHINGDGLDNRRANLRVCNHQQNHFNCKPDRRSSSRFKGVSWHWRNRKWRACIGHNGHVIYLGYFADESEAARAYDRVAEKLFGEFANLNFSERERI